MKMNFWIISGTPQEELKLIINQLKYNKYFKGVFGSPKEKTDLGNDLLLNNNLLTHETIFIGDALCV